MRKKVIVRRILIKDEYLLLCSDNPDQEKYPVDVSTMKKVNSDKHNRIICRIFSLSF